MTRPLKRDGFLQGIYTQSSTKKHEIGEKRTLADGRTFRYAKAGSSALSAGKMAVAAAVAAVVTNKACTAASVGDKTMTLTIGSSTYAADYFAGGYFQVNDTGMQYEIESSSSVAAGTSISITLRDAIRVALTTSNEFTLIHSPFMATVESGTEESVPVGVSPIAVTAAYYYWAQTGGLACCLETGTPATGTPLMLSSTAGAVTGITTDNLTMPRIGFQGGTVGVSGQYKPVVLTIDT